MPRPYSNWPTPEIPNNVPQMVLERTLKRNAERQASVDVRFGWRLHAFVVEDEHVVADIEDVRSGRRHRIKARYLIGIDGASSTVRRGLGLGMTTSSRVDPGPAASRWSPSTIVPAGSSWPATPPTCSRHLAGSG
ncbi:MAG: FAD-dependent monooxygenase [Hyphomicrobiales bacterium]|nr:FAD-dependent monooxygenase [Hyphomicrobiales bacterium]